MQVERIETSRNLWPGLSGKIGVEQIFDGAMAKSEPERPMAQLTGLDCRGGYYFLGDNQTSDTRRPQGVAFYDDLAVNSWYYRSGTNADRCKLTFLDRASGKLRDVIPLTPQNGRFRSIYSHAGGIGIAGDYLYITDDETCSIRVFCLRDCYPLTENPGVLATSEVLATSFTYFLPQVGQIFLSTPNQATISYMAIMPEGFLVGNFYDPDLSGFQNGGKSMIWHAPCNFGPVEFVFPGSMSQQFEPLFPSGPSAGLTVSRIQGALLLGGKLIINRSWSVATKQLLILDTYDPEAYFCGTAAAPKTHHETNWLYGCEGLCLVGDKIATVTEFVNQRQITLWGRDAMLALASGEMTIEQHSARVAALWAQANAVQAEATVYESQVNCAIEKGLTGFNRSMFVDDCI